MKLKELTAEAVKKTDPYKLIDALYMVIGTSVPFDDEAEEKEWDDATFQLRRLLNNITRARDKMVKDLNKAFAKYEKGDWDEADALGDLLGKGYTLDDFRYDPVRYEWARRIAEEHGLT